MSKAIASTFALGDRVRPTSGPYRRTEFLVVGTTGDKIQIESQTLKLSFPPKLLKLAPLRKEKTSGRPKTITVTGVEVADGAISDRPKLKIGDRVAGVWDETITGIVEAIHPSGRVFVRYSESVAIEFFESALILVPPESKTDEPNPATSLKVGESFAPGVRVSFTQQWWGKETEFEGEVIKLHHPPGTAIVRYRAPDVARELEIQAPIGFFALAPVKSADCPPKESDSGGNPLEVAPEIAALTKAQQKSILKIARQGYLLESVITPDQANGKHLGQKQAIARFKMDPEKPPPNAFAPRFFAVGLRKDGTLMQNNAEQVEKWLLEIGLKKLPEIKGDGSRTCVVPEKIKICPVKVGDRVKASFPLNGMIGAVRRISDDWQTCLVDWFVAPGGLTGERWAVVKDLAVIPEVGHEIGHEIVCNPLEVAPSGCWIERKAHSGGWVEAVFKARAAIFPAVRGGGMAKSRYIGKWGSPAHSAAIEAVKRRNDLEKQKRWSSS